MKSDSDASVRTYWRGLGLWNVYFLAKLILYWTGHANFHAFYNLVFASILLLPLPPLRLHRLRHALAVPIGITLLYYDSWLPPFRRLLEQPEVLQFSAPYLLELVNRFINWNMVGAGILLLVACLFLSQWVRVTVLSVSALVICAVPDEFGGRQLLQNLHVEYSTGIDVQAKTTLAGGAIEGPLQAEPEKSITETLTAALDGFHETEAARTTAFNVPAKAPDFDIIFLSICSLSWSDLASAQLARC